MKKEWVDLLLRSFDKKLTSKEQVILNEALHSSPELQKEQAEILKMRQLFIDFSVKKEEGFVANIMKAIAEVDVVAKHRINHYLTQIFPKTIAACILVIMSFMVYIYLSEGSLDAETLVGINDLSPEEAYSFLQGE